MILSRRVLVESRAPGRRTIPDLPAGTRCSRAATALLTLGIIKGSEWGWGSPRVIGAFAAAIVLGPCSSLAARWHRSPMLDLGLLRIRSLAVANVAHADRGRGLLRLRALQRPLPDDGLALLGAPGRPRDHARAVRRSRRGRPGRPVGRPLRSALGALRAAVSIWAAGVELLIRGVGLAPNFLSEWLPAMIVLGIGAGITFPVVGAAAVASVSGGRFATATGLNSISRQLGAVLGVSLLVAIIGTPVAGGGRRRIRPRLDIRRGLLPGGRARLPFDRPGRADASRG